MKKVLSSLILLSASLPLYAANTWTQFRNIGDIYTYTDKDTLYVNLEGINCPNTKNYFSIHPAHMDNAKQLISMVLAAKMSKTQINVLYDPEASSTFCYFKGLILKN